jgi:hypothetical protein
MLSNYIKGKYQAYTYVKKKTSTGEDPLWEYIKEKQLGTHSRSQGSKLGWWARRAAGHAPLANWSTPSSLLYTYVKVWTLCGTRRGRSMLWPRVISIK